MATANLFYGNNDIAITMEFSVAYDCILGRSVIEDRSFYYTNTDKNCGSFVTKKLLADDRFMDYADSEATESYNERY